MKSSKGISLLELTLSASLMGLLFFSGLQMLSGLLTVQARFGSQNAGLSLSSTLLESRLQMLIAGAQNLVVNNENQTLTFTNQGTAETLSFLKTATHWELRYRQKVLGQWPLSTSLVVPHFTLANERLIKVQWPQSQTPLIIWLRNYE